MKAQQMSRFQVGDRVLYSATTYGRTVRRTGIIIDIGHERETENYLSSTDGFKANNSEWVRVRWDEKTRKGNDSKTWVMASNIRATSEVIEREYSKPATVTAPAANGNFRNNLGVQFNARQREAFDALGLSTDNVTIDWRDSVVCAWQEVRQTERALTSAQRKQAKEASDWSAYYVTYCTEQHAEAVVDLNRRLDALKKRTA